MPMLNLCQAVVSDGAKIRSFLADTESFELAAKTYFDALESEHLTKDVVKDCIKCMRQELGLPPAQEMVKFDERYGRSNSEFAICP